MEVCTAGAVVAPGGRMDRALVLLRRVGVVVGVLFGLGLIAAVVADRAAAEQNGGSAQPVGVADQGGMSGTDGLGRLTEPLTKPLTDTVVKPLADAAVKPVADAVKQHAPMVRAVTDPLVPVVRSVVAAIAPLTEPVLRPVVAAVDPVLASVAPVPEPVLAPVLEAEPIVAPVTEPATEPVSESPRSFRGVPATVPEESSFVHSGPSVTPASPVPQPDVPGTPSQHAVTGGGSIGGSGGAHGADGLVSGSAGLAPQRDTYGRSPPGAIVGSAWFAYDDRDHPS